MVRDKETLQFSSVAQSCPTLCDSMDSSTPGFPVHHQLPELAQTHVHQVGDDIQQSHPLSSPSPPAFNPSQHQDLFWWVSSSHQVAKVLENSALASVLPMNIQDWIPLGLTGLISLQSKTLKSLFQHHSSKASILQCSALDHLHLIKVKVLLSKTQLTLCSPINHEQKPNRETACY